MPSDAEVTQRAGSLRSLTGLTETEFQACCPMLRRRLGPTWMSVRSMDNRAQVAVTRPMAPVHCPRARTNGFSLDIHFLDAELLLHIS